MLDDSPGVGASLRPRSALTAFLISFVFFPQTDRSRKCRRMAAPSRSRRFIPLTAYPIWLLGLLCILWLAGGASRADALGQVVVRGVSASVLVAAALFGPRLSVANARPVALLLACAIALPLLQLVPLPPEWWSGLPGRGILLEAARVTGGSQPWRPLAIVPGATFNAAASLLVPVAVFVLVLQAGEIGRRWAIPTLVGLITGSMLLGLLQFAGAGLNNPFINDSVGQVSGPMANRNHFALMLAVGCLLCPAWAFSGRRRASWRAPAALGLVLIFVLTIIATGSRAGLLLGGVAILLGLFLARDGIRRELRHRPSWVLPALTVGTVGMIIVAVLLTVNADRAVAIDRVFSVEIGQDMRHRALPVILEMIRTYFPVGTGFGSFDPIFRIHEPFDLLKLTYFNHAHNDWLEVVLDGGLFGLLLLLAAVIWWGWATIAAWRAGRSEDAQLARVGSAIVLLVMVASLLDYPARTPIIMALLTMAATWLSVGSRSSAPGSALPGDEHHL